MKVVFIGLMTSPVAVVPCLQLSLTFTLALLPIQSDSLLGSYCKSSTVLFDSKLFTFLTLTMAILSRQGHARGALQYQDAFF